MILEELTNCVDTCLDRGIGNLKIAKVTPTYKFGKKKDPSNYRLISVLSVVSKGCVFCIAA